MFWSGMKWMSDRVGAGHERGPHTLEQDRRNGAFTAAKTGRKTQINCVTVAKTYNQKIRGCLAV